LFLSIRKALKSIGIIPARYASTRLPGKPLALIGHKPMIQWVYESSLKSHLDELIVATDDERIFETVTKFGGKAVMTSSTHQNGTERIAEAVQSIPADVVVNIQGDEPFIQPAQINLLLSVFEQSTAPIATLANCCSDPNIFIKNSVVKVVLDRAGEAMYFSRSAIPFHRQHHEFSFLKHIGIYGFRKKILSELVKLPSTAMEKKEGLEQLRWMEHGYRIAVAITEWENLSIDTPEDLEMARKMISSSTENFF
jgi:3-deoxy-manno-octulosonate cytidylyltransferase (CMP-KDO synthetase)